MIVFVPDDAEYQIARILGDYARSSGPDGGHLDYNGFAGLAHHVMVLLRDWKTQDREAAQTRLLEQRTLTVVGPDIVEVDRALLVIDRVIHRYCEPTRRGLLRTTVPCCGRAISLTQDAQHAVCGICRLCYTVSVYNEGDDGWGNQSHLAIFTVAYDVVAAQPRHKPRRQWQA